ncbi:Tetratricopeptide repeat protein 37 [Homalodisca vitripennis]|nr:Tetratricopeptide repeat protein 37 [Homalodisca vitripennis]
MRRICGDANSGRPNEPHMRRLPVLGLKELIPDLIQFSLVDTEVRKFKLAQHAFIKATMLDNTVAAPWSNLGCLYLRLDELKLANAAFSAAQRTDSEYCPSWVGQALIAERVQNEETMDLFRHTTQLGYHPESSLGYGQWVCQTLRQATNDPHYIYSIERMHAVPVAIDALTWSTDDREDDACGLNMLGCLLERCGRYRSSVEVLSRAVDQAPPTHRDKVLANFGRVLLKAEKVEDAVQVYRAISKADIHSQCGLALALYRDKQYQEAFEAYEAALNWWAQDDAVKSHLHVAMAAVAYKLAGADLAKTLLLKGNQLKPTSVYGLFAACSLGMLNSDLELSKMVLRDLLKYQNEAEYIPHIALFQAYTKFLQCDFQGSVWSMSKTVHVHPSLPALWLHQALLILNKHSVGESAGVVGVGKVGVAAHSARTAMTLGRTKMDVSKVLAVVSLSQLMSGDANRALSASQHAVHLYPAVGESWAVLATSCHAASVTNVTPAHLRSFISHARQNIELERPLAKWMSNFERKISLLAA